MVAIRPQRLSTSPCRILLVDDNRAIHDDFRKVLCPSPSRASAALDEAESALFGAPVDAPAVIAPVYEVDSAYQGVEAIEKVRAACEEGRPYALAFVDVRMPPGMDGVETAGLLWREYPDLQIVLCTAYSDYSWDEMATALGRSDRYVILGPSGCGKSTLLKAVGGFIRPVEGEIRLNDVAITKPGPDRVLVFQEFDQLLPWKTVKQNIAFALTASGKMSGREADERALHYINKVGLTKFADNFPHTLSDGEAFSWKQHRAARLLRGEGGARSIEQLQMEIDTLAEHADERAEAILAALYDYADQIAP